MNWDLYHNFEKHEFDCKHTGKNKMRPEFMAMLQDVRVCFGKPMIISSGYRDITHPIEASKKYGGEHTYGLAADISVSGVDAMELVTIAYQTGFRRIGVSQKGEGRFIHLGLGDRDLHFPQAFWSY